MDCQIETSNGAGIHPIKAAKNIIPTSLEGKTWLYSKDFSKLKLAKKTAMTVLTVNNIITNFEMESSALYFLGQSLGHSTITICAIMGNRPLKTQSENYSTTIQTLIKEVLNKI